MSKKIEERFSFYKIENDNTPNNFILLDNSNSIVDIGVSMLTCLDIVKDRCPIEFYMLSPDVTQNYNEIKSFDIKTLKVFMIDNQKAYFSYFKKIILLHKENVRGITYEPTSEKIVTLGGHKYFNKNLYQCKYKFEKKSHYEFTHLERLMKNILQDGYHKFIELLAWKKQNPTIQIPCHFVIQDKGGTGKTEILSNYILENLFPVNIVTQIELESPFNNYMSDCQFVIFEEVEGYSDEKKLKAITGAKTLLINGKFDKVYKIQNRATIIINSNELKSIKIGVDDRRFNIVGGGKRLSPVDLGSWRNTLFKDEEENILFFNGFHKHIEEELQDLNSHLLTLKVSRTQIQIPLKNQKKQELIDINATSEIQFLMDIKELSFECLISDYYQKGVGHFYKHFIVNKDKEYLIVKKGFYDLYKVYCKETGLKEISKNPFYKRLHSLKIYQSLFEDEKIIKHEGKTLRVLCARTNPSQNYEEANSIEVEELNGGKVIETN